jgi:hypothetical protein
VLRSHDTLVWRAVTRGPSVRRLSSSSSARLSCRFEMISTVFFVLSAPVEQLNTTFVASPSQLAILAAVQHNISCACHGPTWIEIDDGSEHAGGAITGHCYDTLCIDNKEAHWAHPLSDCARVGGMKPFCVDKCACHGPTWMEIDDGSGHAGGAVTGHCYDKLCIYNKEAHWAHPLSDCARVGGMKPFCA